jgi:enamine deaminase RidA (YjgF/YER057c/UK114 family)
MKLGLQVTRVSAAHPAQTVVGVVGLALPDFLIEIECTAAVAAP